jgi:hypothetical protein
MNVVRILHLEWNLPNPLANCYQFKCVMRGIRRQLGDQPCRKLPITPELLKEMLSYLDMSSLRDAFLWAVMRLSFYGLLRIASVLCGSADGTHNRHVTRGDLLSSRQGVSVTVRTTKTIQFNQRPLTVPLPRVANGVLCPSQALALYLQLAGPISAPLRRQHRCFVVTREGTPLTAAEFNRRVKGLVAMCDAELALLIGLVSLWTPSAALVTGLLMRTLHMFFLNVLS